MSCSPGTWHQRDRERLFSYFAALPYAAKQHLRDTTDTSELLNILSAKDVGAFDECDNPFEHAMDMIYGYNNSLDCGDDKTCQLSASPMRGAGETVAYTLRKIEIAVHECAAMHTFPISQSFTVHLKVFAVFWLALQPLVLVEFNGWLVFFYIIPIGFSVVNLIKIGEDLADPFGFDEFDIPLHLFCEEIKHSLHEMYHNSQSGTVGFVHGSTYSRTSFLPQEVGVRLKTSESAPDTKTKRSLGKRLKSKQEAKSPSPLTSIFYLLENIPFVRARDIVLVLLWNTIAVFTSYGISFAWNEGRRNDCHGWCSPIDVDLGVLENIGFALFMILAFRVSDAIGRYEDGARLTFDMMQLRTLANEVIQNFRDGMFHEQDKERLIAHIVQIPLSFREPLLNDAEQKEGGSDGLLSASDKQKLEGRNDPISYLLQTIEAYIVVQDKKNREGHDDMGPYRCQGTIVILMLNRMLTLRELIQRAFGVKRFTVVKSYTRHQHFFTLVWLVLLPFAMTPSAGFFRLLWAPIISYGVTGLEEIAVKLVDPYGTDAIDIPVNDMCVEIAGFILDAVRRTD
ncbi:bestrophin [Gracilaria domingensis]|nr:bestrophin [Gracilaria domingensis]